MLIFISILAMLAAATAGWGLLVLRAVGHAIPDRNEDFDLAGLPIAARRANPAAEFYAGSAAAQVIGASLRRLEAVAPRAVTRAALALFCTPLPWKLAWRATLPSRWAADAWPFEEAPLAVYRRRGLPAGRPPVLLVHGWAGSGTQLLRIGDALADAGFDPVLLDFPAHGRSGGWQSTLPQFVRAIHAATARLGPLHGVVAHSLGGVAAMHALARGLPAERLVLIAPSASPALFLRWFAGSFGLSEAVPEAMRRRIEAREAVALEHFEPEWLGPRIAQPVLVIHDTRDRVAPFAAAERVVRWVRDGRLVPTQGLGHARVLDDRGVASHVVAHLGAAT